MKDFFMFSKNAVPSRARNIIAIGWWVWTVFLILLIIPGGNTDPSPFTYVRFLIQVALAFGINKVPTLSKWNSLVLLTGILTFNPILLLGYFFAKSEYKIYGYKSEDVTAEIMVNPSNGERAEINSTARKVIAVGWWLRWLFIAIILLTYKVQTEISINNTFAWQQKEIMQSNLTFILTCLSILLFLPQLIALKGKNKIPQSSGWSAYFIVIGLLSIDPLYFIGGLLARSEKNRVETKEMIKELKVNTDSYSTESKIDTVSEITKLKDLVDQGIMTDEEFSKAKQKLIEKM